MTDRRARRAAGGPAPCRGDVRTGRLSALACAWALAAAGCAGPGGRPPADPDVAAASSALAALVREGWHLPLEVQVERADGDARPRAPS